MTDEICANSCLSQDSKQWGSLVAQISTLENIALKTEHFKVGRSTNCDLVLSRTNIRVELLGNISKQHFNLIKEDDKVYLVDVSKNGTYLNGKRLHKNTKNPVKSGDKIAIGVKDYTVFSLELNEELPDTLSPVNIPDNLNLPTTDILPIWGRLISCMKYLNSSDLTRSTVKVGRSGFCDIVIERTNIEPNIKAIFSKEHFVICKDDDNLVTYIKDLSKAGTYLNGQLIGKDNMHILQNEDIIAIGNKKLNVYLYKCLYSQDFDYLPVKLKKRYQPSVTLGKGGAAEVRLAFEKTTCKMFAIKKILKARSSTSQMHKLNHPSKIYTEIEILEKLSHPFVIRMKEIVETSEEVFIVLDYMKGGELTNRILTTTSLTESSIKFLFYQIVLAVQFLHSKGITHRDLKPENVLLESDDIETLIKVSDFGLSKITEEDDMMKTVCGTYYYVAPEILDSRIPEYNKQVDVWSLGVILFYMLSKRLPFKNPDTRILSNLIIYGYYTMNDAVWTNISRQAKDLVKRLLTVNPQERITINGILKHPWLDKDGAIKHRINNLLESNLLPSEELLFTYNFEQSNKRIRLSTSEESSDN